MSEGTTRILLVEDNAGHAELIRRSFRSHRLRWDLTTVGTLHAARNYLDCSVTQLRCAE